MHTLGYLFLHKKDYFCKYWKYMAPFHKRSNNSNWIFFRFYEYL